MGPGNLAGTTVRTEWNFVNGANAQGEIVDTISEPTDSPEILGERHLAEFTAAASDPARRPKFQTSPPSTIQTAPYKSGGAMTSPLGTEAASSFDGGRIPGTVGGWIRWHRTRLDAQLAAFPPDVE